MTGAEAAALARSDACNRNLTTPGNIGLDLRHFIIGELLLKTGRPLW